MPLRPTRALVVLVASAALIATPLTAYVAPAGAAVSRTDGARPDAGKEAAPSRAAREAHTAVTRATAIASGRTKGDLTMALRDVANTRIALSGAERKQAEDLLKRPTDAGGDETLNYGLVPEETPVCSADICVHYVASGPNASTPAYAAQALATLTSVHDTYIAAGYREPNGDGALGGGSNLIDIYLGNIGNQGLYGYCTSDQPEPDPSPSRWDRWAYCVLDNDYSPAEFPTNTPVENLQVTVAHEYFHATQFAYDRYEDGWLLEATAAWVEDEMYDGVDDNLQYLRSSQLTRPGTPLDTFDASGFHYGTWSFFRFLTEKFRAKQGRLPKLVLDIFKRADGRVAGPNDYYSWQAVNAVLGRKGTNGAKMLAAYAVANRRPAQTYSEGRANRYPTAPLVRNLKINARRGAKGSVRMKHLTTATVRLTPQGLRAKNWKLKLDFNLADKAKGSLVVVTTTAKNGKVRTAQVKLNKRGDAVRRVTFSNRKVKFVEVTLVNGSGRFSCYRSTPFSCSGIPKDDRNVNAFRAVAVR